MNEQQEQQEKNTASLDMLMQVSHLLQLVDMDDLEQNLRDIDTTLPIFDPSAWIYSQHFREDYSKLVKIFAGPWHELKAWKEESKNGTVRS